MKKITPRLEGWLFLAFAAFLILIPTVLRAPMEAHHKLLVASENVKDGPFKRSVILVLRHDVLGAIGVVINKGSQGGPVARDKVFVLHTSDVILPQSTMIKGQDIGYAEGQEAVDALKALSSKPRWSLVVKGYAGWDRGQLDKEIAAGGWQVISYDEVLVTKTPRLAIWSKAIRNAEEDKKKP